MNKKLILIAGAVALASFAAADDAPFGPAQGAKTLSVSGSYMNSSGGGVTLRSTNLSFMGSYFFSNTIEGRLGLMWQNLDAGGGSVNSDAFVVGGRFYFTGNKTMSMQNPWAPFVGVFFNSSKLTGSDRSNGFGAELGAHYFLQPNVSITPTLSWQRDRFSGTDVDTTAVGFGLTIWFK